MNTFDEIPFGTILRQFRRDNHHSQVHVSRLTGAQQPTVSRWEQGILFPEPFTHRRLARYLDVPVADLRRMVERSALHHERARIVARLTEIEHLLTAYTSEVADPVQSDILTP